MPSDVALRCDYQGRHFGAPYPDAQCIDGFLWDEDSCDEPGGALRNGGHISWPKCNSAAHATYHGTEDGSAPAQTACNEPGQMLRSHMRTWRKFNTRVCDTTMLPINHADCPGRASDLPIA